MELGASCYLGWMSDAIPCLLLGRITFASAFLSFSFCLCFWDTGISFIYEIYHKGFSFLLFFSCFLSLLIYLSVFFSPFPASFLFDSTLSLFSLSLLSLFIYFYSSGKIQLVKSESNLLKNLSSFLFRE